MNIVKWYQIECTQNFTGLPTYFFFEGYLKVVYT